MGRYVNQYQIQGSYDVLFNQVSQYLASEGYKYVNFENENLFKKGDGWMTGPTFIKLSANGNVVTLEAWLKMALLPGVFVGEEDLSGFVGAAPKSVLKKRVLNVESIIAQFANQYQSNAYQAPVVPQYEAPTTPQYQAPVSVQPNFNMPLTGGVISKKEFRANYVPNFNKDIKKMAIFLYILTGLSLVSAFINPLAFLDTALLLGLSLGVHLGKSKACAIIILVYACINSVIGIVLMGSPIGIGWIIAGIFTVRVFTQADKQYNAYIANNRPM